MSENKKIPDLIKEQLNSAIMQTVTQYKEENIGYRNFTRERKLTMETMIKAIISMQGGSLNKELYELGINVSVAAFSKRRKNLSWLDFENVFECFNEMQTDCKTYKGYRLYAVDGTTINMPRNPNAESFVTYKGNEEGYNQLHVNPIYDILNRQYIHCLVQPQPKQDEVGALTFLLQWYDFEEKTLIIADRGYESYNLFAHCIEKKNIDFLIRVKQNRTAMREVAKLPMEELDVDLSFTLTTTQRNIDKANNYIYIQTRKNKNRKYSDKTNAGKWDFQSPYTMTFRVVRFLLDNGQYETIATTLPRTFSLSDIKELYHMRWGIETAFRDLKYNIGLVNLHGKSDDYVKQEIFAAMTISNFCSRITNHIVIQKKNENMYAYAVNWKMAVTLCIKFYRDDSFDSEQLMEDIQKYIEPIRKGRKDERKLKTKSFVGFIYRVSA